jgi:hypothetical protein
MKRIINFVLLPHILVCGIIVLLVYEVILQGPYISDNSFAIFVGILLMIFAHKISLWWNERINEQRTSLADHFKISIKSASLILYGLPARFTDIWAFRSCGLLLTVLGFYNIYTRYLNESLRQGLNNDAITGIIINIFMAFALIQMWLTRPYKKIIIRFGVSWVLVVISYILSIYVSPVFSLVCIIAFISCCVYLVKLFKAYLKFKKEQS